MGPLETESKFSYVVLRLSLNKVKGLPTFHTLLHVVWSFGQIMVVPPILHRFVPVAHKSTYLPLFYLLSKYGVVAFYFFNTAGCLRLTALNGRYQHLSGFN